MQSLEEPLGVIPIVERNSSFSIDFAYCICCRLSYLQYPSHHINNVVQPRGLEEVAVQLQGVTRPVFFVIDKQSSGSGDINQSADCPSVNGLYVVAVVLLHSKFKDHTGRIRSFGIVWMLSDQLETVDEEFVVGTGVVSQERTNLLLEAIREGRRCHIL